MIVKIAMPQRFQLKMAAGFGDVLLRRTNEVHYIGGTDVLPPLWDSRLAAASGSLLFLPAFCFFRQLPI